MKILLPLVALAATAQASVIVDFGGDYIAANVEFTRLWTSATGGAQVAYNDSQALHSGAGSLTVYGAAYRLNGLAGAGNSRFVANQDGANDIFMLDSVQSNTTQNPFGGMLYWKKENFLNGGNVTAVDINANISFSTRVRDTQANGYNLHWMFRDTTGNFYVTQQGIKIAGSVDWTNHSIDGTSLAAANWVAYNPAAGESSIYINPALGSVVSPDLTDITAVGLYATDPTYGTRIQFRVADFEVSVIPEPATYVAMFGALALGLVIWRRRR